MKCHQCHTNGVWRDGVCLDCLLDAGEDASEFAPHPSPPVATAALPGTPARIEVYAQRAVAGWSLWHPADARITDGVTVAIPASIARLRSAPPPRVRKVWVQDVGQEDAA